MGPGLKAQNMAGIRAQRKGLRAQKNGIRDHKAFGRVVTRYMGSGITVPGSGS